MLSNLLRLLLIAGAALLIAPFLCASLAIDTRGIVIPGRVYHKDEWITTRYQTGWQRIAEATIEYDPPDSATVAFHKVRLDPIRYDALHVGQTVSLHYLRRADVPTVPLSHVLLQMHALPQVRLADQRALSGLPVFFTPRVRQICLALSGVIILFIAWRVTRSRLLGWTFAVVAAIGALFLFVLDFPTPTPGPVANVQSITGRVKSMDRISDLFRPRGEQGFKAEQPIDIVGIEFVPAGRTERVVTADLIDAESIPGLKEGSAVVVNYESHSPRTAHLQAATRTFVSRNMTGVVVQLCWCLIVMGVLFAAAKLIGYTFNWLAARPRS